MTEKNTACSAAVVNGFALDTNSIETGAREDIDKASFFDDYRILVCRTLSTNWG